MPVWDPDFEPKNPPEKVYVGPFFLRSFPGNEAHKLFSGGPKWRVLGGGQKVYVENIYVLFRPLHGPEPWSAPPQNHGPEIPLRNHLALDRLAAYILAKILKISPVL